MKVNVSHVMIDPLTADVHRPGQQKCYSDLGDVVDDWSRQQRPQ